MHNLYTQMEFYIDIKLYILCFKQMHCVKRIKCCGWTDEVTFLYHPDSVSSELDDDDDDGHDDDHANGIRWSWDETKHQEIKLSVGGQPNVPHTQT